MIASLQKPLDELAKLRSKILGGLKQYTPEQLAYKPDANTWSLNEIVEHLFLVETAAYGVIKKKAGSEEPLKKSTFKHTWRSFLLKMFLRSSRKFKLPPKVPIVPTGNLTITETLQKWEALDKDVTGLLSTFSDAKANELTFKHPLAGYLSTTQALKFLYEHHLHHLRQLETAKAALKK